jgi:hypothetical protein
MGWTQEQATMELAARLKGDQPGPLTAGARLMLVLLFCMSRRSARRLAASTL